MSTSDGSAHLYRDFRISHSLYRSLSDTDDSILLLETPAELMRSSLGHPTTFGRHHASDGHIATVACAPPVAGHTGNSGVCGRFIRILSKELKNLNGVRLRHGIVPVLMLDDLRAHTRVFRPGGGQFLKTVFAGGHREKQNIVALLKSAVAGSLWGTC